ncbi:MAG: FAD-binding protein [Candidatus Lokiarchaeota archaeon]|nr:FAD-binding protein [Candidatus Lokiarchaeota archaeon]
MSKIMEAYNRIEDIVGSKYVSNSEPVRYSYSRNADPILKGMPDIIVRPETTEDVSEVVKIANQTGTKIIPRGGGADLTGGAKPIGDGGIVIDLTRMNRVLDVDLKTRIVTVECGISWSELCDYLKKIEVGYYTGSTGPASGFGATIGGGLSNNSVGGGGAQMYGAVTEQCVGLEVVLPTGEIINTGAKANQFMDRAFTRFALGPDYSGIFLGDVGIHGVKTKASFNIYPLPEYAAFNTFDIKGKDSIDSAQKAADIMIKWQHSGLKVHDFYFYTETYARLLKMFQVKKCFVNADIKGGIMFYTTIADSNKELEENVETLNKIADIEGVRKLGDTVEDGNLGKWFYEEDGRWQWAHIYWGLLGPAGGSLGTCLKTPTDLLPDYVSLYQKWIKKNTKDLSKVGGGAADFIVFGVHPNYIDVTGGIAVKPSPKHVETIYNLWKDLLIAQIKELGGLHYWMGEIIGHSLVESGALDPKYLDFIVNIKKILDPNKIMSPNKFHLAQYY